MSDYPETHVIEIDKPKGMPLQIKGLFFRGRLKWMSVNVISPDGEPSHCEIPDECKDEMFNSMKHLLKMIFIRSEGHIRKRP
jgi:hypothetical protein